MRVSIFLLIINYVLQLEIISSMSQKRIKKQSLSNYVSFPSLPANARVQEPVRKSHINSISQNKHAPSKRRAHLANWGVLVSKLQTPSFSPYSPRKTTSHGKQNKLLMATEHSLRTGTYRRHCQTKLAQQIKEKRRYFNQTLLTNKQRLNQSFGNFYRMETLYDSMLRTTKQKKALKGQQPINQLNQIGLPKKHRPSKQFINQYRFQLQQVTNCCYEGTFPLVRYGATLLPVDENLYLYGGYSSKGGDEQLQLHRYNFQESQWVRLSTIGLKSRRNIMKGVDPPSISPCYHSAESYRGYMMFIGGMAIDTLKKKRYYNSEISTYHIEKKQWGRIKWNTCIRSHASTLYGNVLVVYGGITEKDQYTNQIHLVTLNNLNIASSYHYEVGVSKVLKQAEDGVKVYNQPIAYHQMINTSEVDPAQVRNLPINAIFTFGGRYSSGLADNNVRVLQYSKLAQLGQNTSTKNKLSKLWQILPVKGQKPESRYCHSMNLIKKTALALVIGGKNQNDMVLQDSWVLDFLTLSWVKVQYVQPDNIITNKLGIFQHSVACINSQFFIYGGTFGNNEFSSSFLNMNCEFKKIDKRSKKEGLSIVVSECQPIQQVRLSVGLLETK